jgi:hypothetical protein
VRHARAEDLVPAESLLEALRQLPELEDRTPGSFYRGPRGFLHFHAHAGDLYADVKLKGEFERVKATTADEQSDLLAMVRQALRS